MNTQTTSIIRQPGEGETINAYGDTLELKLGTPDTGGLLSLATAGLTAILIVLVLEHDHSLECVAGENLAA